MPPRKDKALPAGVPPTARIEVGAEAGADPSVLELSDGDILEVFEATPAPQGKLLLYLGLPNRRVVRYGPFAVGERDVPPLLLGRTVRCHVQIDHREVSRQHLRIDFDGTGFVLRDLQSSGGTWHEGRQVQELRIADEMDIELARSLTITFRIRMPG